MKSLKPLSTALIVTIAMGLSAVIATAAESKQKLSIPGKFIRVATTDDGWVTLGYRLANTTVGEEWMLLEVVLALPKGVKHTTITRSDIVLVTPDSKGVPLATQEQFQDAAYLRSLNSRSKSTRDPINYAPRSSGRSRPLNFFGDPSMPGHGALGKNQITISDSFSVTGRLYFHVPGGIQYGPHNLDVQFTNSMVKVPFEIMTREREKEFDKAMKEAK
jgi:hypothetical protein